MPRIRDSQSSPYDFCRDCMPKPMDAIEVFATKGDAPDGRGNCYAYNDYHPPYANTRYQCDECHAYLTEHDDYTDTQIAINSEFLAEYVALYQGQQRLQERVKALEGEVHDCPVCHEPCKQCRCMEEKIEALEAQIRDLQQMVNGLGPAQ